MGRKRNFKAEYQRRLDRASARGLSRSQARGHARSGEPSVRAKPKAIDEKLEAALKFLRQTGNQGAAAKEARVAPERFRRFLREYALADRDGRSWRITDNRVRYMKVFSAGDSKVLKFVGFEEPSINGRHQAAVGAFLGSNNIEFLLPFVGRSVIDAKGNSHPLETDPNRLHRIAAQGEGVFHEIYRLTF